MLKVNIPSLSYDTGTFVIETAAGTTYYPFSYFLAPPTITDINTDMPVTGETLSIKGTYFVQVDEVRYGDVKLTPDQFTVADTEDQIDIVFGQKPSRGSEPKLTVVTGGGEVSVPFYNYDCLLTNFEGDAADNGWGPNASYETANGVNAPYTGDGTFARINVASEGQQWWGTMIYFRKDWSGNSFPLPSFDVIPADATADEVYLTAEVYNNYSDYNKFESGTGYPIFSGYLRYMIEPIGGGESQYDLHLGWENYDNGVPLFDGKVLADINGDTPEGKWYRHVLPLSKFGIFAGLTYQQIVEKGINQFRIQSINQGGSRPGKIDVCFDNIRIFYQKKQ